MLIPNVGLTVRDDDRLNRTNVGYRRHDGKVAIPRFLPLDGGRGVGFCNGRQTHDIVTHLIERSTAGQGIDLFGYTFDRPAIADALTKAAMRGVFVRLILSSEEAEGSPPRQGQLRRYSE